MSEDDANENDKENARLKLLLEMGLGLADSDSDLGLAMKEMSQEGVGSRPSVHWDPPTTGRLQALLPQYEFITLIGRGGMGAVYKARQKSLDRLVAVKVLPGDILDENDANFVQRFQNEAKTMARMKHASIVSVYDYGETKDHLLYFVMEYVEGTDVADLVKSLGKLSAHHAMTIAAHVCDALSYAHGQGVVHRDIKPANVLINYEGQVKVADFGLAKAMDADGKSGFTSTRMTMGTPDYAAPEALILGKSADHRADLYAVGVMLYNMLTGEIPRGRFKGASAKVRSDPRFDDIINQAMQTEREDRYQSAADIRRDLDRIMTTPIAKQGEVVNTAEMPKSLLALKPFVSALQVIPYDSGMAGRTTVLVSKRRGYGKKFWVVAVVVAAALVLGAVVISKGLMPKDRAGVEGVPGLMMLPDDVGDLRSLREGKKDEMAASRMVLGKGGKVVIEQGSVRREVRSEGELPKEGFSVVEIKMGTQGVQGLSLSVQEMSRLYGLDQVERLEIFGATISDASLEVLLSMPKLTSLVLNQCKTITDGGMAFLGSLKGLRSLSLEGCSRVGSAGLFHLAGLRSMRDLYISNMAYVDDEILPVLLGLQELQTLHLHGCGKVRKEFIEALDALPMLNTLYVSADQLIPSVDLDRLKALQTLRVSDHPVIKNVDLGTLRKVAEMTQMKNLHLVRLSLTESDVEELAKLKNVAVLTVDNLVLPRSGLALLAGSSFNEFEVGGIDRLFDDDAMRSLVGVKSIKKITLAKTSGVSGAVMAELRQARPDLVIERVR